MPYYGTGIMDRNVNVLAGMADMEQREKHNALIEQGLTQDIKTKERDAKMQQLWVLGRALDSAVDDESYQKVLGFGKELYGEKALENMPKNYDPEFIKRRKFEVNVLYDTIGKGKPMEIYMTNKDGTRKTKAEVGSSRYNLLKSEGWEEGELINPYIPKSDAEWKDIEKKTGIEKRYTPKTDAEWKDIGKKKSIDESYTPLTEQEKTDIKSKEIIKADVAVEKEKKLQEPKGKELKYKQAQQLVLSLSKKVPGIAVFLGSLQDGTATNEDKESAKAKVPPELRPSYDRAVKLLNEYYGNPEETSTSKTVVRTGIYNGRKVVEYSDGTTGYAD